MDIMRSILLSGSKNQWLRRQAPRYSFVRQAVSRFMPGEGIDDALSAAQVLRANDIATVLTHLGENIADPAEADSVAGHYLEVIDRIFSQGLPAEVSVKLTQLGLDLSPEICYTNLKKIIEHAGAKGGEKNVVWIDIEASDYVDVTLELYRRARLAYPNVGICLQAYLYRTARDLAALLPLGPAIRLVKGAYKEPPDRAFPRKKDVDENFFALTRQLLGEEARRVGVRAAIATHDREMIRRTIELAAASGITKESFEFQMLFGIQRAEQLRLAREGFRSIVLISYGAFWFPWFMRRLAERPANVLFVVRNLFAK